MENSAIEYDAFISYKHNAFDSAIAEHLHKKLEHYHIPKVVQQMTGRRRIARVFRDKEELPLTADLTKDIYEALDHAQCLIVICSPESKESLWVQKEVAYYVSKHGKDCVLTVLTDGEPETSFPEILCRDDDGSVILREPLAADVRSASLKQSLRQLDREFLRLAAAIIGCPYDGLKQRHRTYRIKCFCAVGFMLLSVITGIFTYSLYKNRQIFQYQQASLQKEGEILADQSMQSLREGRRADALSLALEMSSLDEGNDFQSPLQAYALNNALYSYRLPHYKEYVPVAESQFNNMETGFFSSDGQFYYALTGIARYGEEEEEEVYVYSGESGEYLYQIDSAPIHEEIEKLEEPFDFDINEIMDLSGEDLEMAMEQSSLYSSCSGDIQYMIPYDDTKLLLVLRDAACLYDAASKEILHCFLMPSYTISYKNYGHIYRSASGDLYYYVKNDEGKTFCYDISKQRELSGKRLAEMGLSHLLEFESQVVSRASISDTQQVLLFHQEPEKRIEAIDGRGYDIYYPAVYDSEQKSFLWTGKESRAVGSSFFGAYAGIRFFEMVNDDEKARYIIYWINKTLIFLDADSGNTLAEMTFDSNILSMEQAGDDSIMVGIENGLVQEIHLNGDEILQNDRLWLSVEFSCVDYNPITNTIAVISDGRVIFAKIAGGDSQNLLDLSELDDSGIDSVRYSETEKGAYRILQGNTNNKETLLVYPTLSDRCIYHYVAENEVMKIQDASIISRDGKETLIIVEYNEESYQISYIHEIDLDSGIEINSANIESAEIDCYNSISFSQDYTKLITLSDDDRIVTVPLNTEGAGSEFVQVLPDGADITEWEISNIDKSFVFVCRKSLEEFDSRELYVYHSGHEQAEKVDYTFQTMGNIGIEKGLFTDRMAIAFDNEIIVLDAAGNSVIAHIKIPQLSDKWMECAFFDQDEYLLVATEKEVLLYEIASGNLLSSWSIDIVDDHTANLYQYHLVVDKSSTYFGLKNSAFTASYDGAWGKKPLIVCHVDDQHNIFPYANIDYGYAHLNSGEIASCNMIVHFFPYSVYSHLSLGERPSNYFQYAPLFDVETLKMRAETILKNNDE